MDRIDEYLEALVSQLECDPLRRDEIRLEVHVHLRELVEEEARSGKSEAEAVARAIERFGPADQVASRLSAVHRGEKRATVRIDRPAVPVLLGALLIVPLGITFGLLTSSITSELMHLATSQGPSAKAFLRGPVALSVGLYPGWAVPVFTMLALALVARRFTPRRPWLWAAVAYAVGTAVLPVLGLVFMLWDPPSSGLLSFAVQAVPNWLGGAVNGAACVVVLTWALPWVARKLGRPDLRLPLPLALLGVLLLTAWAHPMLAGLGNVLRTLDQHPQAPLDLGLAAWPWQLTRLAALLAAMWLAGQSAIQLRSGASPGRISRLAAGIALAAGLALTSIRVAPLLVAPSWARWGWQDIWMCAEFLVLLACGSALLALTRLTAMEQAPLRIPCPLVEAG